MQHKLSIDTPIRFIDYIYIAIYSDLRKRKKRKNAGGECIKPKDTQLHAAAKKPQGLGILSFLSD